MERIVVFSRGRYKRDFDPTRWLAASVILKAIDDRKRAIKRISKDPLDVEAESELYQCNTFLQAETCWHSFLGLDPEVLFERVEINDAKFAATGIHPRTRRSRL